MRRARSLDLARLAGPAALAYVGVFALVQLGLVLTYPGHSEHAVWAVVATAGYLPLLLWQVHRAVAGARPPSAWTVAGLAAIVAAALPVAGSNWLPVFAFVAVSAMLVLPWPSSLAVAVVLAAVQAPLAVLLDSPVPAAPSYNVFAVWWRASALFVPIWLLRALRQLPDATDALAEKAVVDERLRIDGDVQTTIGSALQAIAVQDDIAAGRTESDPAAAAHHIGVAVDVARRASADGRRLLSRNRAPSLAGEVAAAAALLTAAGIRTSVELGDADRDSPADPHLRAALQRAAAAALHAGAISRCVIRVVRGDGPSGLDIRIDVPVR